MVPSFSKSHSTETTSSSGSSTLALKLTGSPTRPTPGVKSNSAVGAAAITSWLPKRIPPATAPATTVFAVAKRIGAIWRNRVAARLFNGRVLHRERVSAHVIRDGEASVTRILRSSQPVSAIYLAGGPGFRLRGRL